MTILDKTISGLLDSQIPEFIVSDNPNFVAFLNAYYQWLEDSNQGATQYHIKNLLNYKDVDQTTDQFIDFFVNDFLPYFPAEVAFDKKKLLKVAREFYSSKGSINSIKFLFRVLYNEDVEIFYPKENILRVSDGKWQIPQAVRLVLSLENENFDVTLLNMREGSGSQSNATCIIESAFRTIDPSLGIQIVEVYLSNISKPFIAEENLVVTGTYANNTPFTFSEKIIGSLSNITINPKYPGLKYSGIKLYSNGQIQYPGDPVVFFGGLANTSTAQKAIAYVNNVSQGSISSILTEAGGWGYTISPNTVVNVIGGGGSGANLIVQSVNTSVQPNTIQVNTDAIEYQLPVRIGYYANAYSINLTSGPGNSTTTVNLNTSTFAANTTIDNYYLQYLLQVVNGTGSGSSPNTAFISKYYSANQIAVLSTPLGATLDGTSNIKLYAPEYHGFANTILTVNNIIGAGNTTSTINLNTASFAASAVNGYYNNYYLVITGGPGATSNQNQAIIVSYNGTTKIATLVPPLSIAPNGATNVALYFSNQNTTISNALSYSNLTVGGITSVNVVSGGFGYTSVPTLQFDSTFETNYSSIYAGSNVQIDIQNHANTVGHIKDIGKIANVTIVSGGVNYDPSKDKIVVNSSLGYGANITFTVDGSGSINSVNVVSGGEGYSYPISLTSPLLVANSANNQLPANGTGAQLIAYGFNDGEKYSLSVSDIGRISDFRLVSRGFDYKSTPNVSLAIIDLSTTLNLLSQVWVEGDYVYQGIPNATTFSAYLDVSGSQTAGLFANSTVRLYNYTGSLNLSQNVIFSNSSTQFYPTSFVVYGDGKAKANAQFLNGLIQYNGYYLNTDGQVSADQYLQSNTKYHNYSYVIQVQKSLSEFKTTLLNILHPSGMEVLTDTVIPDTQQLLTYENEGIWLLDEVVGSNTLTGTVSSNSFAQYTNPGVVLIGNSTNFVGNVFGGDLIVINSTSPLRSQVKTVDAVFYNNSLYIDSNTSYYGLGYLSHPNTTTNTFSVIGANISGSILVGDVISFNIGLGSHTVQGGFITNNYYGLVTAVGANGESVTVNISSNTFGTIAENTAYVVYPSLNNVPYAIISTTSY